jgi:hypothetical protein
MRSWIRRDRASNTISTRVPVRLNGDRRQVSVGGIRQAVRVTYHYNAFAVGQSREDMEKAARADAETYFGTSALNFVSAGVTRDRQPDAQFAYNGTFTFEIADSHPLL